MVALVLFDGVMFLQDGLLSSEPSLGGVVTEDCCVMEKKEPRANGSNDGSEGSDFSLIN